jgi:hypothetical protein
MLLQQASSRPTGVDIFRDMMVGLALEEATSRASCDQSSCGGEDSLFGEE